MAVSTPHVTGVASILAFVFCVLVNVVHIHLSKTSMRRRTEFGKRLAIWSHASMAVMSLTPLLILFSYVHPESILFGEGACACQQWFALAVICYSTGLFFLKMNYLARLDLVLHPAHLLRAYWGLLVIEMLVVNVIQYLVIQAECVNEYDGYGCVASFATWNGWMSMGLLVHDMLLYYLFCVYYIRQVKGKLEPANKDASSSRRLASAEHDSVGNSGTGSGGGAGTGTESGSGSGAGSALTGPASAAAVAREKLALSKKRRKLGLVYEGLIRQFHVTLLAIAVCAVDLFVNTVWMDYGMLWLVMVDCCVVVSLNFLAFRDSQYLVMDAFDYCVGIGCDCCSVLVDLCCCMSSKSVFSDDDDGASKTERAGLEEDMDDSSGRSATSSGSRFKALNAEDDDTEDSFVRHYAANSDKAFDE